MPHQLKKTNYNNVRFWKKRDFKPAVDRADRKAKRREICKMKKERAREPRDPTRVCIYCLNHERYTFCISWRKRLAREYNTSQYDVSGLRSIFKRADDKMCFECAMETPGRQYEWYR